MRSFIRKLPVRIISFVLAVISIICTLLSFVGLFFVGTGDYSETALRADLYALAGQAYASDIAGSIKYNRENPEELPTYEPLNYPFMDYTILCSNDPFNYENGTINTENTEVIFETREMDLTNLPYSAYAQRINEKHIARGIIISGETMHHIYDLENLFGNPYTYSEDMSHHNENNVIIYFEIDSSADPTGFKLMEDAHFYADALSTLISASIPVFIISLIVIILSMASLIAGTDSKITIFERIPLIIHVAGVVLICDALAYVIYIIMDSCFGSFDFPLISGILLSAIIAIAITTILLFTIINYTRRIKAHMLFKTTLFYSIVRLIKKVVGIFTNNAGITVKAVIGLVILSFIQLIIVAMLFATSGLGVFAAFIYKTVELILIIKIVTDWKKIKDGSKRIASGDLSSDIDTSKMMPEFKKHASTINNISDGIGVAVTERMKSERMKTELITNVSHDIKTPLTSIINYVDLLSKHEGDKADETTKEYIEVLDRQSSRLKKLIEDLIEASKASSGNIEMNIEKVNASMIVNQAIAEFQDKLTKNNLTLVSGFEEMGDQYIDADGRYLWRVIDNLLNNICKYSMPGTRVYVDMTKVNDTLDISFKNMSATPLNISADELTERFVRGDSSRNTEGSGLGLSIASNLAELMGGKLELSIDGDLFKAILHFPLSK